jgi:hypothetical protein
MTLGLCCMAGNLISDVHIVKVAFLITQIIFISIQFMYIYKAKNYKEPERKVVESTVIDPKKKDTTIGLMLL